MYYINTDELEDGEKTRCPRCAANGNDKSCDNFHYFSKEDGGYCWACNFTIPSEEYKEETSGNFKPKGNKSMLTQKDTDNLKNKALTPEQVKEIEAKTVTDTPKPYRGVPSDVYKALGVRWEVNGTEVSMYYPITVTEDGSERVVGYKIRKHPKEFYSVGYVGKLGGFLNQSNAVADTLILCAGEIDLATMTYAMELDKYRKSYNIVSSPLGEDSTATMIKLNYDWVNAHKKIICALDNDEAGELAFEKVKAVVDNSKLYKAALRFNDINCYMKEGASDKIITDVYWNALPVKDFGIAGSGSIYDEIIKTVKTESIALPNFLSDLKPVFKGGIPLQEIILLAAASSIGKSAIVNQIMLDWIMTSVHKVLILSFEDTMGTLGAKIASKVSGHNILAMETTEEKLEVLEKYKPEINKYLYTESGEHRFNVIERIPESIDDLKEAIIQSIRLYNSKILIIDPISSLFSDKTNEEQASFMKFLETVKNKYGCTILMSTHTRKGSSGQKDKGEGASFGEDEIRGSSVLVGVSTIVMLLSRDKMNPDQIERNTTKISVSKNRTYSITARDIAKIYYSPQHHTLFSYNYAEANGFFLNTSAEELKDILDNTKAAKLITNEEDETEIIDVF